MESTMVIKVKYEDSLRRFNARVDENEKLALDMAGLRAKILSLFSFPPDAEPTLTYIDEDGDVVTLVDDDDLHDVMRQNLKFLRIDVQLINDKGGKSYARSSGSSTPLRSPQVQHPLPNINTAVAEVFKSVPEPLREALSKLSFDFAFKAAISSPVLAELVDHFTKGGQSSNMDSQSQAGADSSTQNNTGGSNASNCGDRVKLTVDSALKNSSYEYQPSQPFKRSHGHAASMGDMFHKGVQCDGCRVNPIIGPRYKSKVKEDYDLCSICFSEMGNETDYNRIDGPVRMDRPVS